MQIVPNTQLVTLSLAEGTLDPDTITAFGGTAQVIATRGTSQCVPVAWLRGGNLTAAARAVKGLRIFNVGDSTHGIYGVYVWLAKLLITDPARERFGQPLAAASDIIESIGIEWGDGTTQYVDEGAPFDGQTWHYYATPGTYIITVAVHLVDDEPGMISPYRTLEYRYVVPITRAARPEVGHNACSNPVLAVDDAGWSAAPGGAPAGARVAAASNPAGAEWAYEITPDATISSIVMPRQAVVPGDTWSVGVYCTGISSADTARIGVHWYAGEDPIGGPELGDATPITAAPDFVWRAGNFVAPAGADSFVPSVIAEWPPEEVGTNTWSATGASYLLQQWVDVEL